MKATVSTNLLKRDNRYAMYHFLLSFNLLLFHSIKPNQSLISDYLNLKIIVFVINCLTNLMDIFPSVWNTIVNHGAIKCIAEVLERSMGFIDLNESCIKCLEKISLENPYGILTSGTLGLCLNMMDFFENTT